jgi:hypothetical protein
MVCWVSRPCMLWPTGPAGVVSLMHVDQYTVSRPTKWVKKKSTGEKSESTEQTLPPRKEEASFVNSAVDA